MIMTACGLLICTIPFFTKESSQYAGGWNVGDEGAKFCGQNVTETVSCVMSDDTEQISGSLIYCSAPGP